MAKPKQQPPPSRTKNLSKQRNLPNPTLSSPPALPRSLAVLYISQTEQILLVLGTIMSNLDSQLRC